MPHVVPLSECRHEVADLVGGKALGLGFLVEHGFPAPPGFAVTTRAYRDAVARVADRITQLLEGTGHPDADERASQQIAGLFTRELLTPELASEIADAYDALCGRDLPVAVRSSAIAEDTASASFAGQQDTYLWIRGSEDVLDHVVRCWASLFTARAIGYRARVGVAPEHVAMGVVVQTMVPAEAAGVMMTLVPANGDRSRIYVESAFGLGEIVVRGDVDPDRFEIDKASLAIRDKALGTKDRAYRVDDDAGKIRLVEVPAPMRNAASLSDEEVVRLAELGRRVEEAFRRPMDIEWAMEAGANGQRAIQLLQARPETFWSNHDPERPDEWDTLHSHSDLHLHWTTSNVGEAMTGVLSPLGWSLWGVAANRAGLEAARAVGALASSEAKLPAHPEDRFLRVFYGRVAMNVEYLGGIGDRMPGTTGEESIRSLLGRVPDGIKFSPTRARYPFVAARLPYVFLTTPGKMRRLAAEYDAWWRRSIERLPSLGQVETVELFEDACNRFERAVVLQTHGIFGVFQPLFAALAQLCDKYNVGDAGPLSGVSGGAELQVICDIWRASREGGRVEDVTRNHGFHGPNEGEIASRVWREDDSPLRAIVERYAAVDESNDPVARDEIRRSERRALERRVIAAVPATQRASVRLLLKLVRERLPLRGVVKRSFLQALDIARACARQLGEQYVHDGRLRNAEDVFYLTRDELVRPLPDDAQQLVDRRLARREEYLRLKIPSEWIGMPMPVAQLNEMETGGGDTLSGIGVSAGVAEGLARVVTSAEFATVEPGEILVAATTDPSWSSVMFVSSALVVDIGGALSHAAVVARELEIPCIVNTRTGTQSLRTGDRIRVNGSTGTVEILERAAQPTTTAA